MNTNTKIINKDCSDLFSRNAFSKNAFSKNEIMTWERARVGAVPPWVARGGRVSRQASVQGFWRRDVRETSESVGWQNFSKMLLVFGCIGTDFARKYAFCSIFQNLPDYQAEIFEIWQNFGKFATFAIFFAEISRKLLFFSNRFFLLKFWDCSGAKGCKSCRAWKMLSNAYFLAKCRFDTAENEPAKKLQNFVNFSNFANPNP